MENSQTPDRERQLKGRPGTAVQSSIIKLWELIYNIIEEKKSLQKQKSQFEADKAATARKIEELEAAATELKKQNSELIEKADRISAMDLETPEKGQIIEELEKKTYALSAKLEGYEELKKNYQYTQEEIAKKDLELNKRSDEIVALKEKASELEGKINETEELRARLNEAEVADDFMAVKIDAMRGEIEELNNALIAEKGSGADYKALHREDRERLNEITTGMKESVRRLTEQITCLESEKAAVEAKLSQAVGINENLVGELRENERKIAEEIEKKYKTTADAYASKINEYQAEIKNMKSDALLKESKLTDILTKVKNGEDRIKSQALRLETEEARAAEALRYKDRFKSLMKEFDEYKSSAEKAAESFDVMKRGGIIGELEKKINALEKEIQQKDRQSALNESAMNKERDRVIKLERELSEQFRLGREHEEKNVVLTEKVRKYIMTLEKVLGTEAT